MKMYILIKESAPVGYAVNSVAHASLGCYLKYADHPDMVKWLQTSFKKMTCVVTDEEFELAKTERDNMVITESALGGQEIVAVFLPREEYPKRFKFFRKYK